MLCSRREGRARLDEAKDEGAATGEVSARVVSRSPAFLGPGDPTLDGFGPAEEAKVGEVWGASSQEWWRCTGRFVLRLLVRCRA